MRFLAAIIALPLSYAAIADCATTSVFRPTVLSLSPDPPVRGQPIHMTVQFENTGGEITSGTVITALTLNGLPFSPSTESLCQNTACPIIIGFNDRSTESTWPDTVSGKVISRSTWLSDNNEVLLCVETTIKVGNARLRPRETPVVVSIFRDDISKKQMGYSFTRLGRIRRSRRRIRTCKNNDTVRCTTNCSVLPA
jgi:hypothetical protein